MSADDEREHDDDRGELAHGPTIHEARVAAWGLPRRRLARVERRLRRRRDQLDAAGLTQWYAARQVLRERGVSMPPVTRGVS